MSGGTIDPKRAVAGMKGHGMEAKNTPERRASREWGLRAHMGAKHMGAVGRCPPTAGGHSKSRRKGNAAKQS